MQCLSGAPSLPACDELNALLHEHLFGKCVHKRCRIVNHIIVCDECGYEVEERPNYLDGNGMLLVVGKMRELGYNYCLHIHRDDTEPESVRGIAAQFTHPEHRDAWFEWTRGVDEPTATGQAALRALKVI